MKNKRGVVTLIAGFLVVVGISMFLLSNFGPDTISGATITGGVVGVGESGQNTGNNAAIVTEAFADSKIFKHADIYLHYTIKEAAELAKNDEVKKFFLIRTSSGGIASDMYISDIVKSDELTKILVESIGITELSFLNA